MLKSTHSNGKQVLTQIYKKILTKVLKITHPNGKSSSLHENSLLKSQAAKLIRAQTSQKEVLQIISPYIFSKISCFGIFYALRFQIDKTEN